VRTTIAVLLAALAALCLGGCGTTHATVDTSRGERLMLLGYDPVAYFTDRKPVRGRHTLPAAHEGRTYYFATPEHRSLFAAAPSKYEPQYGGFCSNGAAYNVKLGSDPTQFEVRDGRLFIFGDVLGREMWLLDPDTNIRHADALWPAMAEAGWRWQSLKGWTVARVPWYRDGKSLMAEWRARHPGQSIDYDTGGTLASMLKYPGWRAREGHSQPALAVPGEPDDKPGTDPNPGERNP
jgi:YHS domain-containing protein